MTNSARDEILERLRAQEHDKPMPVAWRSRRHFADVITRFQEALSAVGGEPIHVADLTTAVAKLREVLLDMGATTAIVNPDPPLDRVRFAQVLPGLNWSIVGQGDLDVRTIAAVADVGISSGTAGLAETGSVIVESGAQHSRLAILLPPVHIVLLPTSRITVDLFTWVAERQQSLPSSLTIITGPSKTADIEQTLATGVHGPGRFIVILFDEW